MAFSQLRAVVLGAAVITLTLTACAPTGQPGEPGVAATYENTDVTNGQIDSIYESWLFDTKGTDVANRRQVLTIELLHDDLVAKAAELGYPVTEATAKQAASQWINFKGETGAPSAEMIRATQGIYALMVVSLSDPTLNTLRELSDNVAKSVVVSPRNGQYSTEALLSSVNSAVQSADSQDLQQFTYTEFQNVTAFADEDRPWFDRS